MNKQPEALRLAIDLMEYGEDHDAFNKQLNYEAAAELQLLHAEVERLRSGYQGACYACEPVAEENIRLQNLNNDLENWVATLKERISYMKAYPQNYEREWFGLTSPELINIAYEANGDGVLAVQLTEAKLKEKNSD